MSTSRRMKMSSITGFTSQADAPSVADTTSASRPPPIIVLRCGLTYG
jgi:hypothetical protein